jgi:peptide/nickel transport system substrate-binding protein
MARDQGGKAMDHVVRERGMSRRRFLRALAVGGAAVGAGAASPGALFRTRPVSAAGVATDTLIVGQDTRIQTFDPQIVYDNTVRIARGIYEPLVGLEGSTPKIVPKLATSWSATPDIKQWTLKLRPGVKFHDGTPFDSEAVKVTMERLIKINRGFAYAFKGLVASVDTPDPLTARFTLSSPDASFISKLAAISGNLIVSPKAVRERASCDDLAQGWLKEHGAGTGPYMLRGYDKGAQQVILAQFPGYWGGWSGQHVKRVIFRIVPEASTQRLMVERGEADIVTVVSPDLIDALAKEPGIAISENPTMRIFYIAMHCQREPLKDVKIRQALSYAFDYEGAKQAIFNGKLAPLNGPLPDNDPAHLSPSDKPYRYDLQKARQLLSESSRPNGGFTLSLSLFQGDPTFRKAAEILQARLKELNIDVNIQELASSVLLDKAGKPDTAPDLLPVRNYPDYADSSALISGTFGKDAWGTAGWNFSFYANDHVEQLLTQANQITNQLRRNQLFKDAQRTIVQEAAAIFIGTLINRVAMRSNVHGFLYNPLLGNTFDLYQITKS